MASSRRSFLGTCRYDRSPRSRCHRRAYLLATTRTGFGGRAARSALAARAPTSGFTAGPFRRRASSRRRRTRHTCRARPSPRDPRRFSRALPRYRLSTRSRLDSFRRSLSCLRYRIFPRIRPERACRRFRDRGCLQAHLLHSPRRGPASMATRTVRLHASPSSQYSGDHSRSRSRAETAPVLLSRIAAVMSVLNSLLLVTLPASTYAPCLR